MKKKGLILSLLLVIVLLSSVALSACSLVKLDEERQANRVMATVTADVNITDPVVKAKLEAAGITDYSVSIDVTRRELITNVNYTANYYSQLYSQYGLTYDYDAEELTESTLTSMTKEKYYIIKGIEKLLNNAVASGRLDSMYMIVNNDAYKGKYGNKLSAEGVLTLSEWYNAVGTINDSLESQIDGYTSDEEDNTRETEIGTADDTLSELYGKGYFVTGIAIAKKTDAGFEKGLYQDSFILSADSDDDDAEDEIDYTKVYIEIELKKDGEEKAEYVYRPASETSLTLAEDESAAFVSSNITGKIASVTYSGRVEDKDTEEGYTNEEFTSDTVAYMGVTPRVYYAEEEDDVDYLEEKAVRYASKAAYDAFLATKQADGTYDKTAEGYNAGLEDLYTEIFNLNPTFTVSDDLTKEAIETKEEAYRQLRSSLSSSNIGYSEDNADDVYGGLGVYYKEQFASEVLSAVEYEIGASIIVTDAEIENEYKTLVIQDAAKYEAMEAKDQVEEFFKDTESSSAALIEDLTSLYYIPVAALTETTYEKGEIDVPYATLVDGKLNATAFYVAHILFNFDNVEGLADQLEAAYKDMSDEQQLQMIALFGDYIKTNQELTSYLEEDGKALADVFATDENGDIAFQDMDDVIDALKAALSGKNFADACQSFLSYVAQYNDDPGLSVSYKDGKYTVVKSDEDACGYMIVAGIDCGWVQDFSDTGIEIYERLIAAGVNPTDYEAIDVEKAIEPAYTSYGVHVEFITFAPFYNMDTYTFDGYTAVGLDVALNLDGDTHRSILAEEIADNKQSNEYTTWKNTLADESESHITKNEKAYKALIKEVTDQ